MTAEIHEMARPQSCEPNLHVRLSCDDSGSWALLEPEKPARRFTDFGTALDAARRAPGAHDAVIEVWQDGEYICCLPTEERRYCGTAAPFGRIMPQGRVMTAAERYANRAAEVLLMTAGPLFWAALVVLVLAASLGWRLALL